MISWFVYVLAFLIGVVQTPLIVDLLRAVFPSWNIKRLTNRAASILLVLLNTTFALTGLGQQIFYFIPLFPDVSFRETKIVCHSCFAYWIWTNMAINYYYAVLLHPGSFPRASTTVEKSEKHSEQKSDYDNRELSRTHDGGANVSEIKLGSEKHRYCKKCLITTLHMDHHCPFTGNCVGFNTYSHFFLCLCYASLGIGYSLVITCLYFGECVAPGMWHWLQIQPLDKDTHAAIEPFVQLFLPALGGFLVINIIIAFQVFLLLSDMTTFEVLTHFRTAPIFRIGWRRIISREYAKKGSRLNILLLSQRKSFLMFLVPVRNSHYSP